MSQTKDTAHRNRLLGAMSQADADQFFSALHPVSLALQQIIYEVGAPLEHVYFIEDGVASRPRSALGGSEIPMQVRKKRRPPSRTSCATSSKPGSRIYRPGKERSAR